MLRRLVFLGMIACAAVLLARANSKVAADKKNDRHAEANWDSEGGTPAPEPSDTPTPA